MTLVVNLHGGPGTGKSTTAAMVFAKLKQEGHNAELVTEFAKDLAWEDRSVIRCRPFVFGEQLWRIERLLGHVDVVVTDSPLIMDLAYSSHYGPHWVEVVVAEHRKLDTLDIFLVRDTELHPYNPKGRWQSLGEAEELDRAIQNILEQHNVLYRSAGVGDADYIIRLIQTRLRGTE